MRTFEYIFSHSFRTILYFSIFLVFFETKSRTKHARRLFQPRIVSIRPRLLDPWKTTFNLPNNMEESQRAKGAQNFPVWSGPWYGSLTANTIQKISQVGWGEGNLFCLRKRGNFSNSTRGEGGRTSYFPSKVKTNENTRSRKAWRGVP